VSKILTTHLTVPASAEDVWETLIDLDGYRSWNPFITSGAGTIDVGQRLHLTMQLPDGLPMTVKPWVTAVERHRYLEWLGRLGLPGLFEGRHSFTLTPLPGRRTLLQQSETFTGALVPFTGAALARTRAAFDAMNQALSQRAIRLPK
jgi:hypothetical protein